MQPQKNKLLQHSLEWAALTESLAMFRLREEKMQDTSIFLERVNLPAPCCFFSPFPAISLERGSLQPGELSPQPDRNHC